MARIGHDSVNAAPIYQHATSAADQVIARALDAVSPEMSADGSEPCGEWPDERCEGDWWGQAADEANGR